MTKTVEEVADEIMCAFAGYLLLTHGQKEKPKKCEKGKRKPKGKWRYEVKQ